MILHHLRVSWRNLRRNPAYSILNIGGLAMGLVVAMVVGLWVADEFSYNKSFSNYNRIAQLMVRGTNSWGVYVQWAMSPPYAPELRKQYGEDFEHMFMSSQPWSHVLATPTTSVVKIGYFTEPGFAEMLSLEMIEGDRNALLHPTSVLLSQSAARALFGSETALGKSLRLDDRTDVAVGGVYKDIPVNTDFADLQFLGTWELYTSINRNWIRLDDWRQNGFLAFAEIKEGRDFAGVSQKIKDVKLLHSDAVEAMNHPQFFLHPMSKWRLYSDLEGDTETGRIKLVWMFGTIGMFVLILACINFMNLATARSEKRMKEVGIRKAAGSGRFQLVLQFFTESVLISFISFLVAIVTAFILLPLFNQMAEKQMKIPFSEPVFWIICLAFTVLTGILAGSYPALYLSSFRPGLVLKGRSTTGGSGVLRKVLLVVQFSVSISLIIGVSVVFRQIETGKKQSLGFDPEGLLWVNTRTEAIHKHIDAVRNELITSGKVSDVAEANEPVTRFNAVVTGFDWTGTGPNNDIGFRCVWASPENGKAIGWTILEGRDFNRANITDTSSMILNEAAATKMELKDPVGTLVKMTMFDEVRTYKVVGVVKDLLMESPYAPVRPTIYMVDNSAHNVVNIRINKGTSLEEGIAEAQKVFSQYDPSSPFTFEVADVAYQKKYGEEERIGKLAATFAGLAIFISMLGMLGLASFVAERRSKEIAIRKVLGATIPEIWQMLSKDFVILVLISCVVAIPLSWYYMHDWLQQFEIQTELSWWVFASAGALTLVITLITVSYRTLTAATVNPVNSLGSE
ncbi:MAG TPA: FtsX-like permease family protein [Cyclobacteriaceae bacterium]|nr:FtsX-like permease family protein [Cyclobacteriaceae bacterium]